MTEQDVRNQFAGILKAIPIFIIGVVVFNIMLGLWSSIDVCEHSIWNDRFCGEGTIGDISFKIIITFVIIETLGLVFYCWRYDSF